MMEKQKSDSFKQFIYPIPFEDFVQYREKQNAASAPAYNVQQFKKLKQLKKMLHETQSKIRNRIRLFHKVSNNLIKKREKENEATHKSKDAHQMPKPILVHFDTNLPKKKPKQPSYRNRSECSLTSEQMILPKKVEQVYEEKMGKVKEVRNWKDQNRALLQQMKTKQMRDKVQSANLIKRARMRAVENRNLCEQEKMQEVLREKKMKFQEEVEEYEELQCNLNQLQGEEREALMLWKRAMEG